MNIACLIKGHNYRTEILGITPDREGNLVNKYVAISCSRCKDIKKAYWIKEKLNENKQ